MHAPTTRLFAFRRTILAASTAALLAACGAHPEPSADRPAPSPALGGHCNTSLDCAGGAKCMGGSGPLASTFPEGFCTNACQRLTDCVLGSVCVNVDGGVCLYPCSEAADCTMVGAGYNCLEKIDFDRGSYFVCIGN